jgi:hypothetical protein
MNESTPSWKDINEGNEIPVLTKGPTELIFFLSNRI